MIRLGKMTDYGIVLLSHLARDTEGKVWNARGLAEETGLPLPTVAKLLKALSRHALLVSQRGVQGGYMLARPAKAISMAEIIGRLEGPIRITQCSVKPDSAPCGCELESHCVNREPWQKINTAVYRLLEKVSLADMAGGTGL